MIRASSSGLSAEAVYALAPSLRPFGQRGNYPKPPYRKNADGSRLCRWCGALLPGRARWWCGSECVHAFMIRGDWNTIRKAIAKRDKVCQICRGARWNVTAPLLHFDPGAARFYDGKLWAECRGLTWEGGDPRPYACPLEVTWAVDHIEAVKDGGTDHPENLRLLCGRCHQDVTAAQHRRWALERRELAAIEAPQQRLGL